jgi:hypothetical protein
MMVTYFLVYYLNNFIFNFFGFPEFTLVGLDYLFLSTGVLFSTSPLLASGGSGLVPHSETDLKEFHEAADNNGEIPEKTSPAPDGEIGEAVPEKTSPAPDGELGEAGTASSQDAEVPSDNNPDNITAQVPDAEVLDNSIQAYESAKNKGLMTINVLRFPYVDLKIAIMGVFVNVLDLCSHLSRTSRRKLARFLTNKEFPLIEANEAFKDPLPSPSAEMAPQESSGSSKDTASSSEGNISGLSDKKLKFILTGLGLPLEISMSQLRWILKAVTPEIKNSISTQLKSYKNISKGNKGKP